MKKTTKVAAAVLAAALSASALAGCGLVTTNISKDYAQVIAEVNITNSENFANSEYAEYADVIETAEITKRDMVAYFVSTGYSMMQSYGWTYHDTFTMISETLVNRQIYIQYAMLYLLENGENYSADELRAAIDQAADGEESLAALGYFLTDEEKEKALYDTRVLFNNSLDSQETNYIDAGDEETSTETARTTPTGIDTENEDYYKEGYKVYTGANAAADCAGYTPQDDSTPTTRRKAYSAFLASLRSNDLISSGEDTTNIENLSYFKLELENSYESAIINKMTDMFEDVIRASITEADARDVYNTTYLRQEQAFAADTSSFESALDGVSDTSFVLTAPEANYGFVVNILIPFSTSQSQQLSNASADYGDAKGNKFNARADLLNKIRGTDQRGTWFTGAEDYSFRANADIDDPSDDVGEIYSGSDVTRDYLFFKDSILDNTQYERVPNYYGRYTYNGSVEKNDDDEYVLTPNRIDINEFIAEMEGYLGFAQDGVTSGTAYTLENGAYVNGIVDDSVVAAANSTDYFNRGVSDYYNSDNTVDYSKFIYYAGQVSFPDGFDANRMFVEGSPENVAYSVMNELSFAYNTDTAGLNSYLGYAISTGKTDYVSEFEYAAQYVCRKGAGNYVVVATDYGWHIIYCTFSFVSDGEGGVTAPYTFNWSEIEEEGTFSYLFYEALCSDLVSEYANNMQTDAIDAYLDCAVVYEDRYADLLGLDTAS